MTPRLPLALALLAVLATRPAAAEVPTYTETVVKTYRHDPGAFTEGLFYLNGFLYESTGLNGHSSIRKVALETGRVLQSRDIDPKYFGEGIVNWKDRLIQLTWKSQIGFVDDLASFKTRAEFHYTGQGWALTQDGTQLYMSDGSSEIRVLDPETLTETRRIAVTCDGKPVFNLNELEWVRGEIYANIWLTGFIARIDPVTGAVTGLIDLTDLAVWASKGQPDNVLNGIAYDAAKDRLFVTGKLWPTLYQITLNPRPDLPDLCPKLPPQALP